MVRAVTTDDEQIPGKSRCSALPVSGLVAKFPISPKNLAVVLEGGRPLVAEVHVDAVVLQNWRRRRMTVLPVLLRWFVLSENPDIMEDFTRLRIDRDRP